MKEKNTMVRVEIARPGMRACGRFVAGVEYEVPATEAKRLVAVKGFVIVQQKKEG